MLVLNQDLFLANGGERSSYIHPNESNKIIKVLHLKTFHNSQNELEYIYYQYLKKQQIDFSKIPECFGWVQTNLGKGLIYERIKNYDNSTIRTLSFYVKYNLLEDKYIEILIEELKQYIFLNNILFIDASLSNVFCQKIDEKKYQLIIFDGLGARRLGIKFWFYLHSKFFTKYKMKKQWKKFVDNYHYERSLHLELENKENIEY